MEISVNFKVDAFHCWPEPCQGREYLGFPHLHQFDIRIWLPVSHSDRQIEFHDLKELLEKVVRENVSKPHKHEALEFGSMSCEQIGLEVLKVMKKVSSVRVAEDDCCFAQVDRQDLRVEVVTICGSTRFKEAQLQAMRELEERNLAVFMVGGFMHADGLQISDEQKKMFDDLHKRKIEMSDSIYVVNVDGYVGSSTESEILYAKSLGKRIEYMFPDKIPERFL